MKSIRAILALALVGTLGIADIGDDTTTAEAAVSTVRPLRVLDSRIGTGGVTGRLVPGRTVRLQLPASIADGATAAAINLTATDALSPGHLRAWRCGDAKPSTSNVNYVPGHSVPNLAVVGLGDGAVCLTASSAVHVVGDLTAVFGDESDVRPTSPNRVLDTRLTGQRVQSGSVRRVRVGGTPGIASSATGAVLNFTVVAPNANGYITTFPCASSSTTGTRPTASTLNYRAGETVAATTFSALGAGDVCVYAHRDLDLVVDTFGSVPASGPVNIVRPSRILDTREGLWSTGPALNRETLRLRVAGRGNVPNDSDAAIVTFTVADAGAYGHVTAWPCDQSRPTSSTLNFWPGAVRANTAVIKLSKTSGEICLYQKSSNGSSVSLIADAVGFVDGSVDRGTVPAPPPPPPPPSGGKFTTLKVGSTLPSGAECAQRVRTAPEIRPENNAANNTRGTRANANNRTDWSGFDRVDGAFGGSTDEIIQWAACKWGVDEDMVRAQVVKESWWEQSANGDNGESWGLGQVRDTVHQSAFEYSVNARTSSAYNLDYTYASWRACYEGVYTWLNTVERGATYGPGDAWGCMGVWFSGRWYTQPAINYVEGGETNGYGDRGVKQHLTSQTWTDANFING
jgi:hypothetical protein